MTLTFLRPRLSARPAWLTPLCVTAALFFAVCASPKANAKDAPAAAAPTTADLPPAEQAFAIQALHAREYFGDVQESVTDATSATMNLGSKDLKLFNVQVAFVTGLTTQTQAAGGLTTGTQSAKPLTTGTLTSQQGTLYTDDRPDLEFAKGDILLEGDVRLCENKLKVRAPTVHYFAEKKDGDRTAEDIAFRSGGGSFESEMVTPSGGLLHSKGTYFETNRTHSIVRGFGPGTLGSGAGFTTATTVTALEGPEGTAATAPVTAPLAPMEALPPPKQHPAASTGAPAKKPGKTKPAQPK